MEDILFSRVAFISEIKFDLTLKKKRFCCFYVFIQNYYPSAYSETLKSDN